MKKKKPAKSRPRVNRGKRWHFTAAELATLHPDDPARAFCALVAAAPSEHNRWAHLACKRHALDLRFAARPSHPYLYDLNAAQRPIAFAAEFRGLKGYRAGDPLELEQWQRFLAAQIFGWRMRADQRKRRFRYAFIKVPRKNGKTGFVAPLVLYQLSHPVASCEIYSVATKEDIAKTVLKDCIGLIRTAPGWAPAFRPRHKTLTHEPTASELRPLGSDSDTLDGLRPELVVMDELHAWKDRGLWDVMNSAFGAAHSPLMLQITTEGQDPSGLLKEQDDRLRTVLESVEAGTYLGTDANPATADEGTYAGCLWQPDPGDRWDDPKTWHKANPSLGTVKDLAEMRSLASGARASAGARRDFLIKQLNQRQETGPQRWLNPEQWAACHPGQGLTPAACWERLRGKRVYCGLDLAATTDTSAWAVMAEDADTAGGLLAAWRFWLPDEDIAGRCASDGQPYDLWAREGWLSLTPGPVVDARQIEREILETLKAYECEVVSFAYDPAWTQGVGQRLQDDHALPMVQCMQRYSTLSAPIAGIERAVIARQLDHGGNPIAERHARAATIKHGAAGGMLLAKGHSKGRIDGMAALVMAEAARQHSASQPKPAELSISYL